MVGGQVPACVRQSGLTVAGVETEPVVAQADTGSDLSRRLVMFGDPGNHGGRVPGFASVGGQWRRRGYLVPITQRALPAMRTTPPDA